MKKIMLYKTSKAINQTVHPSSFVHQWKRDMDEEDMNGERGHE